MFKNGRKIICHIVSYENKHVVKTGKPSDTACLAWTYDNFKDAEITAKEYFNNYLNK